MNPVLIEAADVLFFRDAVPMSAGQGKGAGCRLPFPSTLHEGLRASLLRAHGIQAPTKGEPGRPRGARRAGNWHADGHDGKTFIATKAFRSLRTQGPLPWHDKTGVLLPVPMDVARGPDRLVRLQLAWQPAASPRQVLGAPSAYAPPCLPVATTPPDKHGVVSGWWTVAQMKAYLSGDGQGAPPCPDFTPIETKTLWTAEHRVGVEIECSSAAAKQGQLYAGTYLRPDKGTRFAAWVDVADPARVAGAEAEARRRERRQLEELPSLLLGGEFRLARLQQKGPGGDPLPDPIAPLRPLPTLPRHNGPCLLKWVLATPGIFAHGSLPGWCSDSNVERTGGPLPVGQVCLDLPGRAQLVSWCLGKPRAVSGWDIVENRAKPTLLAVPEGAVYYFLCDSTATGAALAAKLHWQPRSDFYGEKGCGYGFASFDVSMHATSPDVSALAREIFQS